MSHVETLRLFRAKHLFDRATADALDAAIAALSQPVAEAVAWRVIKPCGLRRHMTQAQYDANPELQKWYEPFKCASCRDDVASSGLRGTGEGDASR